MDASREDSAVVSLGVVTQSPEPENHRRSLQAEGTCRLTGLGNCLQLGMLPYHVTPL